MTALARRVTVQPAMRWIAGITFVVGVALSAPPAAAQSRADRRAAERLFRAGQDLYERQQYLDAADTFRAAYEKVPDPSFLFNEARACERANALERAIEAYQAYLSAAPDAEDVVQVEEKLAVLRARLRARGGEQAPTQEAPAQEPDEVEVEAEAEEKPDADASPGRGFHEHALAGFLAPVHWFEDADDKLRVGAEYRYGLSEGTALAGQLMAVFPLVSGRANASDGFGLGAFWLGRVPLFDPFDVLFRAGLAFEAYSSRGSSSQLFAIRTGPGLVYDLSEAIAVQLEGLFSPGLFVSESSTLSGEGGGVDGVFTLEAAASLVLGL